MAKTQEKMIPDDIWCQLYFLGTSIIHMIRVILFIVVHIAVCLLSKLTLLLTFISEQLQANESTEDLVGQPFEIWHDIDDQLINNSDKRTEHIQMKYFIPESIKNTFNIGYKGEDQKERNRAISKAIKKKLKLESNTYPKDVIEKKISQSCLKIVKMNENNLEQKPKIQAHPQTMHQELKIEKLCDVNIEEKSEPEFNIETIELESITETYDYNLKQRSESQIDLETINQELKIEKNIEKTSESQVYEETMHQESKVEMYTDGLELKLESEVTGETVDQVPESQIYQETIYQEPKVEEMYENSLEHKSISIVHTEIIQQEFNSGSCENSIDLKFNVEAKEENQKNNTCNITVTPVENSEVMKKSKIRKPIDLITKTLENNSAEYAKTEFNPELNIERYSETNVKRSFNKKEEEEISPHKSNDLKKNGKFNNWSKNLSDNFDSSSHTKDTFYRNSRNNKKLRENNDHSDVKKQIMNEKLMNFIEVDGDIFGLPPEYSIVNCVNEDLQMNSGISIDFKYKYGSIGDLIDQKLIVGDVGEILHNGQYIFYLVVKKKNMTNPYAPYFKNALCKLLDKMKKYNLTKLAVPKVALDFPSEAKFHFSKVFSESNINIYFYNISRSIVTYTPKPPQIIPTSKQLWEMEPQTDLIMFINMKEMYLNSWNDEVVEKINKKYPFKDRLLKDINIKPVAPGDVLWYEIDKEILFCIFIEPINQNPSYYKCLEEAFRKIKALSTGYRYLGIQYGPVDCMDPYNVFSRESLLLLTIFDHHHCEIWLCGDNDDFRAYQYNQYRKFVNDVIETHKKSSSKGRSRLKNESRKYDGNNSNDLMENKINGSSFKLFEQEITPVNYISEEQNHITNT